MGYSTGSKSFTPDNDENTIYLQGEFSLEDIDRIALSKWPRVSMCDVKISTEYIQTDCLGYDQYDPGDYTCFIVVRYCEDDEN